MNGALKANALEPLKVDLGGGDEHIYIYIWRERERERHTHTHRASEIEREPPRILSNLHALRF